MPGHRHETASELVCGADCWCKPALQDEPSRFRGVPGLSLAGKRPKVDPKVLRSGHPDLGTFWGREAVNFHVFGLKMLTTQAWSAPGWP